MAGLLSGLSEIGLGGLENMEVYEQPEDKEAEKQAEEKPEVKEETFLFDKSYECPVCYQGFKAKTVRSGKLRSLGTDRDLRPLYDQMEPLKYDVVICPHCGYAALTRFFGGLTAGQIKAIKEGLNLLPGTKVIPFSAETKQGRDEIWEVINSLREDESEEGV